MLANVFFYNKLFLVFDDIDTGDDRRIDFGEFIRGVSRLGACVLSVFVRWRGARQCGGWWNNQRPLRGDACVRVLVMHVFGCGGSFRPSLLFSRTMCVTSRTTNNGGTKDNAAATPAKPKRVAR